MKTKEITRNLWAKTVAGHLASSVRFLVGAAVIGVVFLLSPDLASAKPPAIGAQYDDDGNPTYAYELGKSERGDNILYYEGEGENRKPVYGWMDFATYNGWRRYHSDCHVCHGPDGLGSTYAPGLVESLDYLSWDDFFAVVINGRDSTQGAAEGNVMPAFGEDPNVAEHVEDLYRYLLMRNEGKVRRGTRIPKLSKFVEEE